MEAIAAAFEEAGAIRRERDGRLRPVTRAMVARAEALVETYAELQAADRQKLEQMIVYSQTAMCRWCKLLEYFDGEAAIDGCGHCDRCARAGEPARA